MNTFSTASIDLTPEQEEGARADMYGLLAVLYFGAPDSQLLKAIAEAQPQDDSLLGDAWAQLSAVCKNLDVATIQDEYHQLFIGVSKPDIMLYGSYYLSGFLMERPLAELRADLAKLGLGRPEKVAETEDHVSSLFEVMRILILSPESGEAGLATQKQFYATHVQPWIELLCDAIENHPRSLFYRHVSGLTRRFIEVENQAFDMA